MAFDAQLQSRIYQHINSKGQRLADAKGCMQSVYIDEGQHQTMAKRLLACSGRPPLWCAMLVCDREHSPLQIVVELAGRCI